MNSRWIIILAFLLASAFLWLPFDDYTSLYETRPDGGTPAGEVRAGFALAQVVRPPAGARSANGSRQPCFAVRFATYARRNRGALRIDWRQGERRQSWLIAARRLDDNSFRHFCPDSRFEASRPFRVEIHGIDGEPGRSPTFWLVDDVRFGHAEITPGDGLQGKSIALQGSAKQHVGPATVLRIDHGAWVFGWLCTLLIGIVALHTGLAEDERSRAPDNYLGGEASSKRRLESDKLGL